MKKNWKSQGILSVRKSENRVYVCLFSLQKLADILYHTRVLSRDRIKNILNCDDVGNILTKVKENDQSERKSWFTGNRSYPSDI